MKLHGWKHHSKCTPLLLAMIVNLLNSIYVSQQTVNSRFCGAADSPGRMNEMPAMHGLVSCTRWSMVETHIVSDLISHTK